MTSTSGVLNYLAPATQSSLRRNGQVWTRRDADGSDAPFVGVHTSVADANHNDDPRPFRWVRTADENFRDTPLGVVLVSPAQPRHGVRQLRFVATECRQIHELVGRI